MNKELKTYGDLKSLSEVAAKAFTGQSDPYKQKLVYKLLSITKTGDKTEFMNVLLHAANARKEEVSSLMKELEKYQENLRTKEFYDIAHAIAIGIMSTYKEKKKQEE